MFLSPERLIGGMVFAIDPGTSCPENCLRAGLGSKVSTWLGPPDMYRKITLRALPVFLVAKADSASDDAMAMLVNPMVPCWTN